MQGVASSNLAVPTNQFNNLETLPFAASQVWLQFSYTRAENSARFPLAGAFRQGCRNGVQRSALGSHPNKAVVFEHGSADMAGNAHDGLVGSLRFRQLGYGAMPQVVESQTGKRAFDSLDFMCTLRILAGSWFAFHVF